MSVGYNCLLAKSTTAPDRPKEYESLGGHILGVMASASAVLDAVGKQALASMSLPREHFAIIEAAVLRGAMLHDLGKANHHFQQMVRKGGGAPQALRHEWISLEILLRHGVLDDWLFGSIHPLVRHVAVCAAVGHHLQFESRSLAAREGSGDTHVRIWGGHRDITALLHAAGALLGISSPAPVLADFSIDLIDDPLHRIRPWILEINKWWTTAPSETRRLVALVKAFVIAADLAASALPRSEDSNAWTRSVLSRTCTESDLTQLAERSLAGRPSRPFQDQVAQSAFGVTLVRAGCGSGKTTAAYLWAARQAIGRKLFFCYPTTGTATEGYAGYVAVDDIPSALIHSRAAVDLEDILGSPDEGDRQLRVEALAAWDVPLVVCTADTVLGLIQNNRRGIFAFPAIANAAFVFDEIHAYDDRMFGSLLRFIDAFRGAPMLLMTASLQSHRLEALQRHCADIGQAFAIVNGPTQLEQIPRYLLCETTEDDAWREVSAAVAKGKRVLWVVNTVGRAVALFEQAKARMNSPILLYHSRFRYCDRVGKHKAVMEAFRTLDRFLAITTQVCEVSLDISADLMVTDLAPVPALIQRLGRLNRFLSPERPAKPLPALVLKPHFPAPYEQTDLDEARSWLSRLGSAPLSQADLAVSFLAVCRDASLGEPTASAWLDGGPSSSQAPLREPGATVPIIRSEDAAVASRDRIQIVRLTIPMLLSPVAKELTGWQQVGVAYVAPPSRVTYSEEWGAKWQNAP